MFFLQTMTAVNVTLDQASNAGGNSFATLVASVLGAVMLVLAAATPAIVAAVRARGDKLAADSKASAEEAKRKQIEAETATLRAEMERDRLREEAEKAKKLNAILAKTTEELINTQPGATEETKRKTKTGILVAADEAGVADTLRQTVVDNKLTSKSTI